ncbi:MAG: symmetrical bis(5'-nucleosyl)-tetraphosphatase [Gammaproteobacteria bacterium]
MAIYAIGDLHGCHDQLRELLAKLKFQAGRDQLWLVGDVVNRGPKSLETLRYVKKLGDAAVCVLGNHDLHLLAAHADARPTKPGSGLCAILDAPDREDLVDWLRRLPLLHHDAALGYTMVHAGLVPQWDLATATNCAREVERLLGGPDYRQLLHRMYGDSPDRWSDDLTSWARARVTINVLTRLRYCDAQGGIDMQANGPPGSQPAGLVPWFEAPGRRSANLNILFGHWSALGYYRAPGIIGMDSSCVWGGALTALRLDAKNASHVSVSCEGLRRRA